MKNEYKINGDETIVFIKRKDGSVLNVLIDTNDLEKLDSMPNTWKITSDSQKMHYVGIHLPRNNGKRKFVRMHRFILDAEEGKEVDHINHNTLDNRKSNLRILSKSENLQNRSGAQSNSKSGIRGVVWNKQNKKWRAQYKKDGKCVHVGSFNTKEEADEAIKKVRSEVFPYSKEGGSLND